MSLIPTNGELWKKVTNTQEREKAPNDIGVIMQRSGSLLKRDISLSVKEGNYSSHVQSL
jgi:hypothetical protein